MTDEKTDETTNTNGADTRPKLVLIQGGRTDDARCTEPRCDLEPSDELSQSERDLRTFIAIQCALAIEEAKLMPTTPEIERTAQALYEFGRAKLAELDAAEAQKAGTNAP